MSQDDGSRSKRKVRLPKDLQADYANLVRITHSPSEVVFDFAQALPGLQNPEINARVLMSPLSAKLLWRALGENLKKYENRFGEIEIPGSSSLAESLFQPPEE
jgi:hypothetical protein